MQSYIDITARKHQPKSDTEDKGSQNANLDKPKKHTAPAPGARAVSASEAAAAVSGACGATLAGRGAGEAAAPGVSKPAMKSGPKASGLSTGASRVKVFGEGKFGSGAAPDASKGKESGAATGSGGADKRKLQPMSQASVNSRLLQPLKSLSSMKSDIIKKPTLVAVVKPKDPATASSREGGGGGGGGGGGVTAREKAGANASSRAPLGVSKAENAGANSARPAFT
eukprot:Tamp_13543.p2 GENE.Tamp_13543~~Tamp_13543.p2  ORF type:complete len:226 (+),score=41.26 Tamp_13543:104-781(+)